MITIEQTLTIPDDRRLHFELPAATPVGQAEIKLTVKPTAEQKRKPVDQIMADALKEAASKRMAYCSDPKLRAEFRALRGCLKDSAIYDGLDGVAYQRKIRDEWEDRLTGIGLSNND